MKNERFTYTWKIKNQSPLNIGDVITVNWIGLVSREKYSQEEIKDRLGIIYAFRVKSLKSYGTDS